MSDWITTQRQQAAVHLTDRRVLTGSIHLQMIARHHSGPETTDDLLNRDEMFYVLILDEGQPVFVAKRHTLYLELPPQPAIEDPDRASAARRLELEIELADGTLLEGMVMIELPPDRLRALDFLNAAPTFFPLWTEDAVRIVNRNHIRAASPVVGVRRGQA
ncbi:MAG: hypothetical protein KF785_03660 [Gemmatimonadales bacterium]|nr:hypothetical protein [Gemmatimonadales bacterium]